MTLTMPERGLDDAAAFARLGRPDAVLFDWDHTLVDAWGAILAAYNDVMIAYGKPPALTPEEGRLRIRRSMRDTFPEIFGDRWQEAALRFKAAYAARHLETVGIAIFNRVPPARATSLFQIFLREIIHILRLLGKRYKGQSDDGMLCTVLYRSSENFK